MKEHVRTGANREVILALQVINDCARRSVTRAHVKCNWLTAQRLEQFGYTCNRISDDCWEVSGYVALPDKRIQELKAYARKTFNI